MTGEKCVLCAQHKMSYLWLVERCALCAQHKVSCLWLVENVYYVHNTRCPTCDWWKMCTMCTTQGVLPKTGGEVCTMWTTHGVLSMTGEKCVLCAQHMVSCLWLVKNVYYVHNTRCPVYDWWRGVHYVHNTRCPTYDWWRGVHYVHNTRCRTWYWRLFGVLPSATGQPPPTVSPSSTSSARSAHTHTIHPSSASSLKNTVCYKYKQHGQNAQKCKQFVF